MFRVHPSITDVRNPAAAGIITEEGEAREQNAGVRARSQVERTQKPNICARSQVGLTQKGGRDRFAPAPFACYEAVVELAEPLAEDPDEEPPEMLRPQPAEV